MTAATASPAGDVDARLTPELIRLALVVVMGTFVVQMDATMVNVALNTLRTEFHATVSTIQWFSTAYLLAMAMAIPPAGWAVDRFGAKRVWMAALVVFTIGSVLCGLAWSAGSMIAFRAIQGVGGGILIPLSQAVLARAAGPKRMGRLMAVAGVPGLLGPIVGPVIGGVLVDDAGWRWIFLVNVPICLLALVLSALMMSTPEPAGRSRLDLLGLLLLSPALAGTVYGLAQAGQRGTFADARVIAPLAGAGALAAVFVWHALHTRHAPIIDLRLLADRYFAASSAMLFLAIMALLGGMLLLPLYYQMVRGETALHAGFLLAPQGLGAAIAIAVCGGLVDRLGARPIAIAGVVVVTASTFALTQIGAYTSTVLISLALMVRGVGFGAVMVPATAAAYRDMAPERIARATSALRIFQQVGASFGVAVLAVVLQRRMVAAAGAAPSGHTDAVGLAAAFATPYWLAVAFAGAALVPALLLPRRAR